MYITSSDTHHSPLSLFFFLQSDKQFSSCLGKKGLQHRTPHSPALFFKHSTVGYSSSLDESNQKLVFCFSSIAINTSHLQLSSFTRPCSAPTPSTTAVLCQETAPPPRNWLLQLPAKTTHPAPRPRYPTTPTIRPGPCGWTLPTTQDVPQREDAASRELKTRFPGGVVKQAGPQTRVRGLLCSRPTLRF